MPDSPKIYTFYQFADETQCPLSLVPWPGYVPNEQLGDIVVPLLKAGNCDIEFKFGRVGCWGVEKERNAPIR